MPRIAKWKQVSPEVFEQYFNNSRSYRELAQKLGYSQDGGGTMKSLHEAVKFYNLDDTHFLGQGWNKNNYDWDSFTTSSYKKNGKSIAEPLIHLRGHKCESCGNSEWLGMPIKLEVHHINGDRSNNTLENLQLLCPNCHSYTETFCYKSKQTQVPEDVYVEALRTSPNIHQALGILGLTQAAGNYDRAYRLIMKYNITHLMPKQEHQDEKSLV